MARPPYQPSLLRLLHGVTAMLVLGCWLSGLIVYSRYDGRWGRLPFTPPGSWIDLHGLAGFLLLPLGLAFAAYALSLGRPRLRRSTNAMALGALALAVASGKLMDEDWLRDGQLHHLAYGLHLVGLAADRPGGAAARGRQPAAGGRAAAGLDGQHDPATRRPSRRLAGAGAALLEAGSIVIPKLGQQQSVTVDLVDHAVLVIDAA